MHDILMLSSIILSITLPTVTIGLIFYHIWAKNCKLNFFDVIKKRWPNRRRALTQEYQQKEIEIAQMNALREYLIY